MCGRYSLIAEIGELAVRFEFDAYGLAQPPRYNIAPTQMVLAVRSRRAQAGIVHALGADPIPDPEHTLRPPMINARAETVAERPSFRSALAKRRCLIPADGFYEWQRIGAAKQPVRITLASGEPSPFAGLWEAWQTHRANSSVMHHHHDTGQRSRAAHP